MRQRQVLVTGGGGQLATALKNVSPPGWDMSILSRQIMDVSHWVAVRDTVATLQPDLIIHAAAATNVDRCEREPDWAFKANSAGARNVARAASMVNADVAFVSTNYVFNGQKADPYHEFDAPDPISVYGSSKLAGETETRNATGNTWVIRTSSVFHETGTNFVATMLRLMAERDTLTVVNDQNSNPTYATDLASGIFDIVTSAPFGTYHLTNSSTASWHEWAVAVRDMAGLACDVMPIPAAEYSRDAQPPANGTMQSLVLGDLGIKLPDWRDALERCLRAWPE
jgi:dTDP-4-dehydrorhamnose reductase